MRNVDVVVAGLGVFGAAAAWSLAGRGATVLAVDPHGPTHRYGSSHGESRIFRRAYWEGAGYLPLLNRADVLWRELEHVHGERLLVRDGGVFMGSRSSGVVELSAKTAEAGGIEHELWTPERLNARFPWFEVGADMAALYEPGAYCVLANRARLAMLDAAVGRGALVRHGDGVEEVTEGRSGPAVRLRSGETVSCAAVITATGPWMHDTTGLDGLLRPVRVPVYWFVTRARQGNEGFPAFLYESPGGEVVYGVPEPAYGGRALKIGFHNRQQRPGDPSDLTPHEVPPEYVREIVEATGRIFGPLVEPEPVGSRLCYYTMTPDTDFVIDRHPGRPGVVRVSACSGHGFKFGPAVGEAAAALALGEDPGVDLAPYSAARFSSGGAGTVRTGS